MKIEGKLAQVGKSRIYAVSMSSSYLIPTAECLVADYNVYVPDLPGFGRSEKPSIVLGTGELVETLSAWMDAAGIGQAVLLGNSYGCQIILEFALRYMGRI